MGLRRKRKHSIVLKENESKAYEFIKKRIFEVGKAPSVRQLANFLGMKSPNSAAYIISSLVDKNCLVKVADGKLNLAEPEFIDAETIANMRDYSSEDKRYYVDQINFALKKAGKDSDFITLEECLDRMPDNDMLQELRNMLVAKGYVVQKNKNPSKTIIIWG